MVDLFLSIRIYQFLSPDNKGYYDSWLDAGAEYDEDNEKIALHAFQYQRKKRRR